MVSVRGGAKPRPDYRSMRVMHLRSAGSRHLAGAAISRHLGIVAIVVSHTGIIRGFVNGTLVCDRTAVSTHPL